MMHYAKYKRDKVSVCNICRETKPLSWDHVPPQGGIELRAVEMQTIFEVLAGDKEKPKLRESQNGVKYRTICAECNSLLGLEYDPTLNDFAVSVGKYLNTKLALPDTVNHAVKAQRLMKALLGHLLAAKVDIENTEFDKMAREYVLDKDATLPEAVNIFYWVYPHETSVTIRDFAMFVPRGTFGKAAIFQVLKYFPIAYLFSTEPEYDGLKSLSPYRASKLDDVARIQIDLKRVEHPYWPEAPEGNNVFFGGQSAAQAIHATPRRGKS